VFNTSVRTCVRACVRARVCEIVCLVNEKNQVERNFRAFDVMILEEERIVQKIAKKVARVVIVNLDRLQIGVQMRLMGNIFGYRLLHPVISVTSMTVP